MAYNVLLDPETNSKCIPITYANICNSPTTNVNLGDYLKNFQKNIIGTIYPIGSYFFSTLAANPKTLLGVGTWEKISENTTIVGQGTNFDLSPYKTKTLSDNSKWAQIFYQENNDWFTASNVLDFDGTTKFSKLCDIEKFYSHNSELEFLLEYEALGEKGRWRQYDNPLYAVYWDYGTHGPTSTLTSSSSSVNNGIYIPSTWTNFRGLINTSSHHAEYAFLDGTTAPNFNYTIGAYQAYNGGISAAEEGDLVETASVSLWVRYDNVPGYAFQNGATGGAELATINVGQLASHTHKIGRVSASGAGSSSKAHDWGRGNIVEDDKRYSSYTGGDTPHNNLQPYIYINIWKRIS